MTAAHEHMGVRLLHKHIWACDCCIYKKGVLLKTVEYMTCITTYHLFSLERNQTLKYVMSYAITIMYI